MALFEIAIIANVLRWLYLVLLFKHEISGARTIGYFVSGFALSVIILALYVNRITVNCNMPSTLK